MGFGADTEMEWDIFWLALADSCAILQETKDRLMWIGGDLSGVPSVVFFYRSICTTKNLVKAEKWRMLLWKWNIQLKIKLFLWLAMEWKILTWDLLQRRGWVGPRKCPLC
jgi:hypothetical protein